ncbi:MAG: PLP-dependent aminotransferase family protein, partial [Lautropia sp.]
DAVRRHLRGIRFEPPGGGSALWLRAPDRIDMRAVRQRALAAGVVFDSGEPFYAARRPPLDWFRLGYSSIPADRIDAGVRRLADCLPR